MIISAINNNVSSGAYTSFKSKTILKPKKVENILDTTLGTAAIYGIAQVNKGVNKNRNKGDEQTPFIETKTKGDIVSVKLNSKGEEEYKIIIESSQIAGEYNITKIFPNGEKKIISSANIDKSGRCEIQKDFISPGGDRTLYKRIGNDNDYQMTYVIKDKNGNIKRDFSRSFKKIDNDTTESIVNGKKHINTFGFLGVESINQDNPEDKNFYIYNWHFEDNMKKLPAEIFYCLRNNNIRILQEDYKNEDNACIQGHLLKLSTKLRNDFFVFAHEIGHIKSYEIGDLAKDKELQKIFEQEKQEALKNIGKVLQNEADYFLNNPFGLEEVIAETYAILSGLDHNNIKSSLGMRTNILMQYFPNTIAYIANKVF